MPTHPTKLVITGVPPGQTADALVARYRAPLGRFHSAQQQNVRLAQEGGLNVHHAQQNLGDAQIRYSNIFGQETLTLTVHPSVIEETREHVEVGYWKWALIEMVVPDMVGFDFGLDLVLKNHTNRDDIIQFADRRPNEEHPELISPEVNDRDRTVSALVDLGDFPGQVVTLELSAIITTRRIKGGDGHFENETGTVVSSARYGARGISDGSDGDNLDGDPFGPGALAGAPDLSTLHPSVTIPETGNPDETQPVIEARILARLQASFDEWAGVSNPIVAVTDHRQSIIWLAHWNFGPPFTQDLPTRWSFSNPHSSSTIATGGVNPNDYNVFPFPVQHSTLYWDSGNTITKTVTTIGYETPFGTATYPVPAPGGVQAYEGRYFRGTDYYVPTWKYDPDRTMKINAVCAHYNPWTTTSHRFHQGTDIPGDPHPDAPPVNDCYRWETANFPERVRMKEIATGLAIETSDSVIAPAVLIGKLKIDTNSGKVSFKAGSGE